MAVCWGNILPTPPLAAKNVTVATPLSFHLFISPRKMTCFKNPQKPQREWKGKSNQEREKEEEKREGGSGRIRNTPLSFHLFISPRKMTCFKNPQKPQREWKGKSNQEREKEEEKREGGSGRIRKEREDFGNIRKKGFLKPQKPQREWKGKSNQEREKEEEKREGGSGRIRKEREDFGNIRKKGFLKGRKLGKKENLSEASERKGKLF